MMLSALRGGSKIDFLLFAYLVAAPKPLAAKLAHMTSFWEARWWRLLTMSKTAANSVVYKWRIISIIGNIAHSGSDHVGVRIRCESHFRGTVSFELVATSAFTSIETYGAGVSWRATS